MRLFVTAQGILDEQPERYWKARSVDPDPRETEAAIWSIATLVLRASGTHPLRGLDKPLTKEQNEEFSELCRALGWAIDFHRASIEEFQRMIEELQQLRLQLDKL
jgi:hypothetical protein